MWNTGWVRNALSRFSASGKRFARGQLRSRHRTACRRMRATPPRWFRASWSRRRRCRACPSPIRRLIFSASARATISFCFAPAATVTVSKNACDCGAKPSLRQSRRQHRGAAVHRARDVRQPLGAVIDRVHRGDHRQQHLRGADVGGRLFAADVLLAGLQRQPIGRRAARIDRQADDAAGQRALQRIAHRHVGRMRAAIAHRHAEALRRTDRDIGAEFAGRGEQRQRQQIGGDDGQRALGMQRRDRGPQVAHRA